jgi:excisionase family DNA binding protein
MRLLTVKEAAGRLVVSEAAVYQLCHRRLLGHVRIGTARGTIRISEHDVERYLAEHRVEPQSTAPDANLRHILTAVPMPAGSRRGSARPNG